MNPRIARRDLERLALAAARLVLAVAIERRTARLTWPPRPGRNGRLRRRPR